jgi:hypothetical protein
MGRLERNIDLAALAIASAKHPQPHGHGPPVRSYGPAPAKPPKATPAAYRAHLKAKRDRRKARLHPVPDFTPSRKPQRRTPLSYFGVGARPGQYDIRQSRSHRERKPGKTYKPNGKRECPRRRARFT